MAGGRNATNLQQRLHRTRHGGWTYIGAAIYGSPPQTRMGHTEIDPHRYRFGDFVLDVPDRQLWRGPDRVDLNARYLDALVLLVRESGRLVTKDRLFEEVWHDVVVSDSALTQCIKEIRIALGDDATNPRYVQTVPRHGYRFLERAERLDGEADPLPTAPPPPAPGAQPSPVASPERSAWHTAAIEAGAGTLGGAAAGLFGGMLYGYGLANADAGVGTLSTLLVLVALCALVGLVGGLGVSLGYAGAGVLSYRLPRQRAVLRIAGAAAGGLVIGTSVKLLGVDAFNLLFGRAPAGITGGPEGAALGAAVALGAWLGQRIGARGGDPRRWHAPAGAGLVGGIAGAMLPVVGGRLMAGSLDVLATAFGESRLELDTFGPLFGEVRFGLATQVALTGLEGLLFGACVVGALAIAGRFDSR